jgi:cell wall assembly regulator SMI1
VRTDGLGLAWQGLLDVLAERAPGTRAALREPVPHGGAVAAALGLELPPLLREWFALHDGAEPFFGGQVLPFNSVLGLSVAVDSVLLTRRIWGSEEFVDRAAADRDPAGTVAGTWLASYVYIGQDGMGGGLFVDLRPGPLQGCVRFWDKVEADDRPTVAVGITELLLAVQAAIVAGGGDIGGWSPCVVDGLIEWSVPQRTTHPTS